MPGERWVFKRPFFRFIQSFFKATPYNESCGVFVQLCGIALNVIDSIKFAKNERTEVLLKNTERKKSTDVNALMTIQSLDILQKAGIDY